MPAALHATAVAIGGRAVLLTGPPGSGKSDLALRLIDRGALLIADDQARIRTGASPDAPGRKALFVAAPEAIAGCLEVRGLGLLQLPRLAEAEAVLVVELAAPVPRLPEPCLRTIAGVALPCLAVAAFEPSAPLKVEQAMAMLRRGSLWCPDD